MDLLWFYGKLLLFCVLCICALYGALTLLVGAMLFYGADERRHELDDYPWQR